MRLLIANDLDNTLLMKHDIRSWTHRILWLMHAGDAVIFMDQPDRDHLEYVCAKRGIDPQSIQVFVLPSRGRFDRRMFDHQLLLDPLFIEYIRENIFNITEVLALWDSPYIYLFLRKLDLLEQWSGWQLYRENGVEFLNSMGSFRALISSLDIPLNPGTVCRSVEDAIFWSRELLAENPMLMVKRAHGGAGAGNTILTRIPDGDTSASGHSNKVQIASESELRSFWNESWDWSSHHGEYPVVVESYISGAKSYYAEFDLRENGPVFREVGELMFENGDQVCETVPARSLKEPTRTQFILSASQIAMRYFNIGHRGRLSADGVVSANADYYFTEVNAQFTGSTHLYEGISEEIVGAPFNNLTVSQITSPEDWCLSSVSDFIYRIRDSGLDYHHGDERGVIAVTPCIGDTGLLIMAIIHPASEKYEVTLEMLSRFMPKRSLNV